VKPLSIVFGIPTGWWIYSSWTQWFLAWISDQVAFEKSVKFQGANTKCVSYSSLIEDAKGERADYLVILETNHVVEISPQELVDRIRMFNCVISPVTYPNRGVLAYPKFYQVEKGERPPTDAPWEITTGSTGLVALSAEALNALRPRVMWDLKDEGGQGGSHVVPIYCFDCDVVDGTILDLPSSLFANLQRGGIGCWADPALRTQNMRLTGYPSYR
jgi:hypothetical protein